MNYFIKISHQVHWPGPHIYSSTLFTVIINNNKYAARGREICFQPNQGLNGMQGFTFIATEPPKHSQAIFSRKPFNCILLLFIDGFSKFLWDQEIEYLDDAMYHLTKFVELSDENRKSKFYNFLYCKILDKYFINSHLKSYDRIPYEARSFIQSIEKSLYLIAFVYGNLFTHIELIYGRVSKLL